MTQKKSLTHFGEYILSTNIIHKDREGTRNKFFIAQKLNITYTDVSHTLHYLLLYFSKKRDRSIIKSF